MVNRPTGMYIASEQNFKSFDPIPSMPDDFEGSRELSALNTSCSDS